MLSTRSGASGSRAATPANQRGQSTVEFVLLVPLLMTLLFLVFEFGRVFGSWLLITNASREGARYGVTQAFSATDQCGTSCTTTDTNIQGKVAGTAQFLTVQQVACNSSNQPPSGDTSCIAISRATDSGTGDDMLTVLVVYQVQTLMPITANIPYLGKINYPGYLTVSGQATMRSEQ